MRRRMVLLGAMLAGCASPTPEFYTLVAVPGAVRTIAARSVELRRIGLALYLDRPEIVRSAAQYRLLVADRQRWGEPFGSMIGRVLTENLVQRLPGTAVYAQAGAISARAETVLEIEIQRFDTDASGQVVLLAQAAVRRQDSRETVADTLRITETPGGTDTASLVAAMSAALGELADQVAAKLGP
jgi:uncharacterized protein